MNPCIDKPIIPAAEFSERRKRLLQQLPPHAIAILAAAPECIRNHDAHYPYRQDSSFYYLTGFPEPEAVAVLVNADPPRYVLFNRVRDPAKEQWDGLRAGQAGACTQYGADEAYPIEEFEPILSKLLLHCDALYWALGQQSTLDKKIWSVINTLRAKVRSGTNIPTAFFDLMQIINEMRLIKSPAEIAVMRYACDISVQAHQRAMQACRVSRYEYELEAELLYTFMRAGSRSPAYTSIVGAGGNSCTLHYVENTAPLEAGDLVLIDAACEYECYAADITRTFPVNGRFNTEQRAIYACVLAAQTAAINAIRPGLPWAALQTTIVQCITEGLVKLGLLQGNVDELITAKAYQRFYMHNSGHWLGLDVHDAGDYQRDGQWRPLMAGMVLTVEPGIYIAAHTPGVDKKWWNIGVRIEDDVLVTEHGSEVLTEALPKEIDAIEALMASSIT